MANRRNHEVSCIWERMHMGEKRQKSKYTVFREKNLRVFKKPYRIISMVICVSLIITMFPALAYAAVECGEKVRHEIR